MIFNKHANLKYKYRSIQIWWNGYLIDKVGENKKRIEKYIRKQIQEDIAEDGVESLDSVIIQPLFIV